MTSEISRSGWTHQCPGAFLVDIQSPLAPLMGCNKLMSPSGYIVLVWPLSLLAVQGPWKVSRKRKRRSLALVLPPASTLLLPANQIAPQGPWFLENMLIGQREVELEIPEGISPTPSELAPFVHWLPTSPPTPLLPIEVSREVVGRHREMQEAMEEASLSFLPPPHSCTEEEKFAHKAPPKQNVQVPGASWCQSCSTLCATCTFTDTAPAPKTPSASRDKFPKGSQNLAHAVPGTFQHLVTVGVCRTVICQGSGDE